MAAYRRVYDSRHLQADCSEPDQLRNPMLGKWVLATFTLFFYMIVITVQLTANHSTNINAFSFFNLPTFLMFL